MATAGGLQQGGKAHYKRIDKRPSIAVWMRYKVAHKLVFSKLKKILGIENGIFFPVAGAAMSNKQATFFLSIGIPILYGYGLTETTATVCCYPFDPLKAYIISTDTRTIIAQRGHHIRVKSLFFRGQRG